MKQNIYIESSKKKKKIDHSIVEYIRIQTKLLCNISLLKVILGVN